MVWGETLKDSFDTLNAKAATYDVPDVQVFTASGTWTKPSAASMVEVIIVGGGMAGGNGGAGVGGNGGDAGEIIQALFEASLLPASATVTIGAAGTAPGGSGGPTFITASGSTMLIAHGGGTPSGYPSDVSIPYPHTGAVGGVSGGANGRHSRFGPGGINGLAGNTGPRGLGYGAGGGGGRQASGATAGGGGGGGGYGTGTIAASGSTSNGGNGGIGYCVIVTHRINP